LHWTRFGACNAKSEAFPGNRPCWRLVHLSGCLNRGDGKPRAGESGIQLVHLAPHSSIPPSMIPLPDLGEVCEATWSPDAKGLFVEPKTTNGYDLPYVDLAGHANCFGRSRSRSEAFPSRDGKKLASPCVTVASNAWAGRTLLP
jgi:hypothetical protein